VQLGPYIEGLQADLAAIAAIGDEQTSAVAERLTQAIRASAGLRLLDVVSEAALELNAQLPSGRVEVRVAGQDPSLVYVPEEEESPAGDEDGGLTARISLRLPESLKASIELVAAREGLSVNAWLVRSLARSVSAPSRRRGPGSRLTGFAKG
jgi:HicB family